MSLGDDNIVSEILNSTNNTINKIELILESKDMFISDKDLIIFCYLLGFLSCKRINSYNKEKILNVILEFSCRNKTNEKDISDILSNLCLLFSDYIKKDKINYNNNNDMSLNNNNNGENININKDNKKNNIFNIINNSQNSIELNENSNTNKKDKDNSLNSKDKNALNNKKNLDNNNNLTNINKKDIIMNNNENQINIINNINNNTNIFINEEKDFDFNSS